VPGSRDRLSNFVVGYHGTDEQVVEDLLAQRTKLEPSPRGYDWLGDGIYFWEDDPDRAMWWAERTHEESVKANQGPFRLPVKIEKPAVVGATIYLGECLNLAYEDNQLLMNDVYHEVAFRYDRQNFSLPTNDFFYRNLDCLIVNETCRRYQLDTGTRIDSVRGVFLGPVDTAEPTRHRTPYQGALIASETYKIVCVRSRRCIVEYFRP
jgi:hypothetical protein